MWRFTVRSLERYMYHMVMTAIMGAAPLSATLIDDIFAEELPCHWFREAVRLRMERLPLTLPPVYQPSDSETSSNEPDW